MMSWRTRISQVNTPEWVAFPASSWGARRGAQRYSEADLELVTRAARVACGRVSENLISASSSESITVSDGVARLFGAQRAARVFLQIQRSSWFRGVGTLAVRQ